MVVVTINKCPPALRGDITKWLFEVSTGVYLGKMSARVREGLWERIKAAAPNGQATMVWSTKSEQGFAFRVHNSYWEPIYFDGLQLMLRPNLQRQKQRPQKKALSNARAFMYARSQMKQVAQVKSPGYVVIDIETTGLIPEENEILELGALHVVDGEVADTFHALIRPQKGIPPAIQKLTGLTPNLICEQGVAQEGAIKDFSSFVGNNLLVGHNLNFDFSFLNKAYAEIGLSRINNSVEDTFALSKRILYKMHSHRLKEVAEYLEVPQEREHRALTDCQTVYRVYEKLKEMQLNENDDMVY